MKTATQPAAGSKTKADTRVVEALNQVLADSYALMSMSHTAHWNVEGPDFFELHKAFQAHYEELFEAIDEIAERIRAIDSFPIGGLAKFSQVAGMDEFTGQRGQKDFVAGLIVGHEKTLDDAKRARQVAGEVDDLETQDLMVKRIQFHQKTLWMLKSVLK